MEDVPTETCARCDVQFDIDEHYRVIRVVDHPHPDDIPNIREEKEYPLCGPCAADFPVWLDPDVDSPEELHPDPIEELFTGSGEGE